MKGGKISKSLNKKSSNEWKEIHKKQSETKLKKYGDKNYNNKSKQQNTMKEKYGCISPLQVPEFNKKFKKTLKNKDWENSNKLRKETLLKKTGFEHQSHNPVIRNKTTNTMIEKYGVENPSQVPEFAEKKLKSSYLKKEYTLPSGKIELVQGYEDFEIDRLLTIYNEDDLILNQLDKPEIWYEYKGKKCRYIPDIYIPKDNKIIEVKSTHTMKLHIERNWLKKKKCIELGYDFEFRIYDNKMNPINEKEFII